MEAQRFFHLLERVAGRDESALEGIYAEYARLILWIGFDITQNYSDADDILSLTFIDIWNNAPKYKNTEIKKPDNWVFQFAKSRALDYYRKNLKHKRHDISLDKLAGDEFASYFSEAEHFSRAEVDLMLSSCLKENEIFIVQKKLFEKTTHSEISKELNVPLGTIMRTFNVALGKIKKYLEKNSS